MLAYVELSSTPTHRGCCFFSLLGVVTLPAFFLCWLVSLRIADPMPDIPYWYASSISHPPTSSFSSFPLPPKISFLYCTYRCPCDIVTVEGAPIVVKARPIMPQMPQLQAHGSLKIYRTGGQTLVWSVSRNMQYDTFRTRWQSETHHNVPPTCLYSLRFRRRCDR